LEKTTYSLLIQKTTQLSQFLQAKHSKNILSLILESSHVDPLGDLLVAFFYYPHISHLPPNKIIQNAPKKNNNLKKKKLKSKKQIQQIDFIK
jgi:hypothetical protein